MKHIDISALFAHDACDLALLSTFHFDPVFFERRLLTCPALAAARRVVVFMDAGQWRELLKHDVPARWLNVRYLVVPVNVSGGVFHPKLSLLLSEMGGQVLCGSHNLTRAGCTSNLELVNALPFRHEDAFAESVDLAREAFAFFKQAIRHTDPEIARIVRQWLEECETTQQWIVQPIKEGRRKFKLLHTYDGGLWTRIVQSIGTDKVNNLFVISPFHDRDSSLLSRVRKQWPAATVEMLVQPGYTCLSTAPLRKLRSFTLSELPKVSRRLHAKLLAWRSESSSGCLVGSANFTTAAFDGHNIETCLLVSDADASVNALFDRQLSKRPLAIDDFVPGDATEPTEQAPPPELRLIAAVAGDDDTLRVSYAHTLGKAVTSLRLMIRAPGEKHPPDGLTIPLHLGDCATAVVPFGGRAAAQTPLLAWLVARIGATSRESLQVWVIQEARLTHEPSGGSTSSERTIKETGQGLPEFLDELAKTGGENAVIEFLQNLTIRFYDGGGGMRSHRPFKLRIRDPFQADTAPEWLLRWPAGSLGVESAICDFVDRHERLLRKHAKRGNINGIENFLDILTTLVRLLLLYHKRSRLTRVSSLTRDDVITRLRTYIEIATIGRENFGNRDEDEFDGYLLSVLARRDGDPKVLQDACTDTDCASVICAILLIAQHLRFDPKAVAIEPSQPRRLGEALPYHVNAVYTALSRCRIPGPQTPSVRTILQSLGEFSAEDLDRLCAELPK